MLHIKMCIYINVPESQPEVLEESEVDETGVVVYNKPV